MRTKSFGAFLALICAALLLPDPALGAEGASTGVAWWWWPLGLFVLSFGLGVLAVLGGIGGGVLFVPLVSGFFPFHLDFVRGAGLLLALSGAVSAAPRLLEGGMASLRLAMPLALVGSITSILGALIGFALPTNVVQTALGFTILAIALLMWMGPKDDRPRVATQDPLSSALRLHGVYDDPAQGGRVEWRVHRTPAALVAFAGIGVLAGMFGLGAGWANVPVLNLLMGAPLKLSVGTSGLLLSVVDTSAAWIYLHRGAVLPILVAPTIVGVMLGAKIGARLLRVARTSVIRRVAITVLVVAGLRSLLKGLGIWT